MTLPFPSLHLQKVRENDLALSFLLDAFADMRK